MLQYAAFAGPAGPVFSFLPFPSFSPSGSNAGFHPPGFRRCPRICPQLAHTALTGPVWGFAGIRFPTHPPKLQTGPYTGFFLSRTRYSSLSPTGKGRLVPENALSQSSGFAHNGPTRLQQGGNPFRWCRSPTWPQKPHTGASLVLTVFSWGALGLVALPNLVPACSLLPLE